MSILLRPDGLAKIKETIRKQQSKSSSQSRENNEDLIGAAGGDPAESAAPSHRLLHDASEPIVHKSQDLIEGSEKTAKVRKIAAGPAAPSYKGFSEAEVKYRIVENKGSKAQDGGRKDKKRQVSIKVQDKRIEPLGTWLSVEEEGKTKKVTRVIAPSRKPAKQQPQPKNKEIITTSSWRAGQELVLRELGPMKKKPSRSKENIDFYHNEVGSLTEERPETQGGEDYLRGGVGSATAAEIQHHKALSEEARKVYSDLHLDIEESRTRSSEREKKWKAPVKRKAPKTTEIESQQQPCAKQRHYDQEQIRKYMQRQKAERVRQKKEEEIRMKEEEEARKRQLEELYNKQKHVSQTSAAVGKKEKNRQRQNFESMQGISLSDLPKHHPYHTDRARFLGSDPENKENHEDEDMEISDSSSTITGDGSDDNTPNGSPRRTKMNVDAPSNTRQTFSNKEVLKVNKTNTNSQPRVDNESSNIRTFGDFTFDIGGVTNKFSQALQAKLNEEPPSLAGAYGSMNNKEHYLSDRNRQNDGLPRSRADRIQAIKDTAATLQNRLKEEARKIQAQASSTNKNENGATSRPTVRWNDDASRRDREEEFLSRYDRVTAANDDFKVFKTNLPGSQPQTWQTEVATSVSNQPKLASGTLTNDIGEDTTITETSTFSEITLTDDSEDEDLPGRKIGTGLRKSDFHAGSSGQTSANKATSQLNIPRPTHPATNKASNAWDDSQPDEFNVFSIYSRRQERMIRPGREPMSKKKASEPEVQASHAQAQSAGPAVTKSSAPQHKSAPVAGRRSPGLVGRRAESPYSQNSESLRTQSPVERTRSKQSKSAMKSVDHYEEEEGEDTLGEESYTQSFESEDKTTTRGKSVSEKHVHSHRSLPATSVKTATNISDRVSPEMESSMEEEISQDEATPRAERMSDSESAGPPRLSPNSLERRFYTEFHNLESMELSLKQLTSVDRTRAVSMAQQETVSLAQMLKAKQQGYDQQLKEIQLKAQLEATEATKQLEDARKRASEAAINAADMIAKVRGEGVSAIQDSTRKLIDTQTQAAKATAEAAKFLSEARALGLQDTNTLAVETATAAAASAVNTALDKKWQGGKSKNKASKSTKRRSDEAQDHDDSESVGSVDDFSINESMTEDEREEKSFRLILPSESHRKKGKHVHSDNESVASEASSTRLLDHDIHTLFKEGSFDKFTEDMVRQFMKEEALQAQHQQSLLKLRENALMEKTKAELQWLEQQRQRIRNKGADDSYPQIKKRQRGLKMKLQEQQEEIRRIREENKAAAKERQRKLYEEITKRQASQNKSNATPRGRLGRPKEVHTEAEVSSIDEASDAEKQRKDYKSDSEIYTEPKISGRRSKQDPEKYKKIHLDERYLTQRQSQLMDRRKNAEELLKWKTMLDKEEHRVFKLEKQALKVWEHKDKDGKKEKEPSQRVSKEETEKPSSKKDNGTTKDSTIKTVSMSQDRDSTVISENITTARDESLYTSIKEDIKTASLESSPEEVHRRMMNDKSNIKNHNRSGSESSVMEDIQSMSSADDSKKMNDSSDDTMTHSYGNETFDDTATATASKKTSKSQTTSKSPLEKLKKYRGLSSPGRSPRGLFSSRSHSRNSESESEDSISLNESQSELSDFEGRIRALNEELRKRKTEADKLKRERKKKKKELMKNKEETLKKQIEAYDNQIAQLKVDLQKEMTHEPAKSSVRPQIKQPKVSPSKTIKTPTKQRPDTDSSGPDSTQISPNIPDDKDQKQISPKTPTTPSKAAKSHLDKISEGSETPTTTRSDKSDLSYQEKLQSIKEKFSSEISSAVDDKTDEIEEDIISAESEPSDGKSKEIKIDLNIKEDIYDVSVSYTEDFVTEPNTMTHIEKLPLSARSQSQISEDIESRNVPQSARSVTEQISEQISENLPSVSASESFIKQLDLKTQGKDSGDIFAKDRLEKENDSEGEISQRSSVVESSRPSSGRSERSSVISDQTEHESSESEKSPVIQSEGKVPKFNDEISEPSKKKGSGLISSNVFDIDDLIDFDNEDMTPVASPRGTPPETSRHDSESRHSDFFTPLGDFEIGDKVSVTGPSGERVNGTLLFKGNVQFAPGVWAGVELDNPEGRHNGIEDGVRYFTCREKHGLIVPAHDVIAVPEEGEEKGQILDNVDVRSSVESVKSINTEDGDLLKFISEADRNVQMFDESPQASPREPEKEQKAGSKSRKEILADKITNDLFESVVRENVNTISKIADKKQASKKKGPPVAPKPAKTQHVEDAQTNGDIDDLEDFLHHSEQGPDEFPAQQNEHTIDDSTDVTVNNMMNDAIEHMLTIRRNNRQSQDVNQSRDSGIIEPDEDQNESPPSPTDEIQGVLDKADDDMHLEAPLRPGSPVPGLQTDKEGHKPVTDSGLFEGDFEDDLWVPPNKSPPAYTGAENDLRSDVPRSDLKKFAEEVFYAVPHEEKEIDSIVSSAVDEFWEQRRYGEPLTDLQPSEAFYTHEEIGSDLISNSRRVFKKLLFDLSGEIIRNIYKEEEYDSPVAWHKPKRKTNKFYKGAQPPRTVDVLKPAVQEAVIDILGLNGAKKSSEKTKWGIRKKKDLVDTILVQELREEEPEWVNYDDDELAVKMQLTETIFNDLLTDTVQTMNRIFRKKQSLQQQK
ncbi:centrosome-associated protein 350-like isoform X2 [Mercenaria mercenaria]|uniref:centrosome-associated protein 350-like isoform X2 n=1 Tax=Mercenaria mercenaria TaxID=6596 RepID=UPI00234E89FE|nr:centrosome-associated protein 350-like isoform X2 [Mercenaria mercenaria]